MSIIPKAGSYEKIKVKGKKAKPKAFWRSGGKGARGPSGTSRDVTKAPSSAIQGEVRTSGNGDMGKKREKPSGY